MLHAGMLSELVSFARKKKKNCYLIGAVAVLLLATFTIAAIKNMHVLLHVGGRH